MEDKTKKVLWKILNIFSLVSSVHFVYKVFDKYATINGGSVCEFDGLTLKTIHMNQIPVMADVTMTIHIQMIAYAVMLFVCLWVYKNSYKHTGWK